MPPSKTARRSSPSSKSGEYQSASDVSRIMPLNNGRHAYVFDFTGRTRHMSTADPAFIELIASLDRDGRIGRELDGLAERYPDARWDDVAQRLADHVAAMAASETAEDAPAS